MNKSLENIGFLIHYDSLTTGEMYWLVGTLYYN